MPPYKIFSCDLDGTLLGPGSSLSQENDDAIRDLTRQGVTFVINTGRAYTEIPDTLKDHPAIPYVICSNGAVIYGKKSDTRTAFCMNRSLFLCVLDILLDYDVSLNFRTGDFCYVDRERHNDADYAAHGADADWRRFFYQSSVPKSHFLDFCRTSHEAEMICAFFADGRERTEASHRLAKLAGIKTASTAPSNIEIFSDKAGKGTALLHLAAQLGVDPADTVAVGDTTNDTDMIVKAGLGLAMENAYPELKALADAVVCRNTEHVVPYVAKHYFFGQNVAFHSILA